MHEVLRLLSINLEPKTRRTLQRRVEILMRGVNFEAERDNPNFHLVQKRGWSKGKIEILCCLNSFYQVVLGPLTSASRSRPRSGLVSEHAISYGNQIKLTNSDAIRIQKCHNSFNEMIILLGIDFWCLQANHSQDLLYRLAKLGESDE